MDELFTFIQEPGTTGGGSSGTGDFDKIVTAKYTGIFNTDPSDQYNPPANPEIPLVVIDNDGNVVVSI